MIPVTLLSILATGLLVHATPVPAPTGVPTTAAAKTELAALTVAVLGSQDGYARNLFPTWSTISGTCNTRETVLKRDGTNVVVNSACASTSGSWISPYDGATWTAASDLDIDHMVPLSNAWKAGASAWTTEQRRAFANDLVNPQLLAVTDNVNESKGDRGPEAWKPPLASYWCTYAKMWIKVKSVYDLTVTTEEKAALTTMIATC
ncbi:secreted protein [Sclerotinia borealis F-4128]|uniref:Secreted protein n=1 Tax=Sclerotinia borealis (strain F-4128) TaxID=1432307 RepID=W9C7H2_SCLBF|nr:secreted protein [Sclerotinia borealis F-4128]